MHSAHVYRYIIALDSEKPICEHTGRTKVYIWVSGLLCHTYFYSLHTKNSIFPSKSFINSWESPYNLRTLRSSNVFHFKHVRVVAILFVVALLTSYLCRHRDCARTEHAIVPIVQRGILTCGIYTYFRLSSSWILRRTSRMWVQI